MLLAALALILRSDIRYGGYYMLYVITQLSSQSLSIPRGEIHPTMVAREGGGQPRSHYRLARWPNLPPAATAAIAAAFPALPAAAAAAAAIAVAGGAAHETGTATAVAFDRQRQRAGERRFEAWGPPLLGQAKECSVYCVSSQREL